MGESDWYVDHFEYFERDFLVVVLIELLEGTTDLFFVFVD